MFTTKYTKSQPKAAKKPVKRYENGGLVANSDREEQARSNESSGANDLPITVLNRDGSRDRYATARLQSRNFVDAVREQQNSPSAARNRARKGKD